MRFTLCGLLLGAALASGARVDVMDEIVCKVNGDIITRNDLERDRKNLEEQLRQQNLSGTRLEETLKAKMPDLLRDRIDKLLMVQKGKELDLKVDADLNKRMADIQRRSQIPDPQKFQEWVREQTGLPYEDFRGQMKDQLLTEGVIREEIARKITFKTEELKAYYDQHQSEFQRQERVFLRNIFISTQGKEGAALAAAEKKAKDVDARAKNGEKFADLAQSNSDDAATAQDGGAMPAYGKGEMLPELEKAIWDQPRNFVSDPIKLPNGYIILRVDEHYKAGLASFEEVQQEIQNRMMEGRLQPAERAYLTKLRESAFLEIKPGYVDSAAAPGKDTAWMDPAELKPQTITKQELNNKRKKRLLKLIPIPGTTTEKSGTSSSR